MTSLLRYAYLIYWIKIGTWNNKLNFKEKYIHIAVGLILAAILTYIVCDNIYEWFAWNAAPNLDQPYGSEIQWDRVWVFWAGLSFFSIPVGFGIGVAVSVLFSRLSWLVRSRVMDYRGTAKQTKSWFNQDTD